MGQMRVKAAFAAIHAIEGHHHKFWVTENIDNLSKSRQSLMLKRGILTEIPDIEARDF